MAIVYGTSDAFLNFGEVLLTHWVSEKIGVNALFFVYPKGKEWDLWEKSLFEPYEPPLCRNDELVKALGICVRILDIREMIKTLPPISLEEMVEIIRKHREIQSFRVLNFPPSASLYKGKAVYASSKDKQWSNFRSLLLQEIIDFPELKVGGSIIYFAYGAWLVLHSDLFGILPRKLNDDVLGAFRAGEEWVHGKANIVITGEFDFMTRLQWLEYAKDNKWRKAPLWVARRLLERPNVVNQLKTLLIEKKEYVPLVYDEERDVFYRFRFPQEILE